MTKVVIGTSKEGTSIGVELSKANRHGLVTGATGTGKTVTLQRMAEEFSSAGVPVFAADVKGDLSGIAIANGEDGSRAHPVALWDLFGNKGTQIKTSVMEMGAELLASMLRLNETQAGALAVCFKRCEDRQSYMLTLDDLRWELNDCLEERDTVSKQYGNITASSISAIQRNLLALEAQGGDNLFGEPPFSIEDLMRCADDGRGIVNLLHADQLMEAPKLYSTFLLWLLTELFRTLPEAGDLDKPKLVFFFDEAHLLFRDAPKPLLQQIERLVRLIRSKGVGVFFVTQSPADVPDTVLGQLGNRIQHALRAYTPKDQRMIKAAVQAFRPNRNCDVKAEITTMGVGQALISVLDQDGIPTPVEKIAVTKPSAQIGPVTDLERDALRTSCPMRAKYQSFGTDAEQAYNFTRRMKTERGIELGPGNGPTETAEGLYQRYVPDHLGIEKKENPQLVKRTVVALVCLVASYGLWHLAVGL